MVRQPPYGPYGAREIGMESLKLLAPGQMLDTCTLDFFARYGSSFRYSIMYFNILNAI